MRPERGTVQVLVIEMVCTGRGRLTQLGEDFHMVPIPNNMEIAEADVQQSYIYFCKKKDVC